MRWFSHRARTWKDTVLKIKIKKKEKGFTLVATALAVLCWIFIAQAFFMMSSGTLSTVKAERTAYQAEQNTALDVSRLKALDYYDLDSKGAHDRKVIEGVGDGNWESEVTIDPEQPLNGEYDDAKLRIAHVKVYRTGDTTSRYSLDVPLTSRSGYVPVGSVITWPSGNLPDWMTHGDYLECNGQTFDVNRYPKLYKALGSDKVPNYQGLFLRGYGSQNYSYQEYLRGRVTQNFASDEMGTIQIFGTRHSVGHINTYVPEEYWEYVHSMPKFTNSHSSYGMTGDIDFSSLEFSSSTPYHAWLLKQPPKKYTVTGNAESGYSLVEKDDVESGQYLDFREITWAAYPALDFPMTGKKVGAYPSNYTPAMEVRPINTAVRYFIKAR